MFKECFGDVYDDPETELQVWRAFYATQFEGDEAMQEYLRNIDAAIAFESILKYSELATVENLVENCKFLESAETLEKIAIPFPWTTPTKERSPPPSAHTNSANTSMDLRLEEGMQTERDSDDENDSLAESNETDGGNDMTTVSTSQSTHIGRDEGPAATEKTEVVGEMTAQTEDFSRDNLPSTNGGNDMRAISPSQSTRNGHDEDPAAKAITKRLEMTTQKENSPTDELTNGGDDIITISPSQSTHTGHDERPTATETAEKAQTTAQTEDFSDSSAIGYNPRGGNMISYVVSIESRSLNSFAETRQQGGRGLRNSLVGGMKKLPQRVKGGGKAFGRICACRFKRSADESEKQG